MSRRSTVEKVLKATSNVTSGTSPLELVAGSVDSILAPKMIVVAGGGAGATVTLTHGTGATLWLTLSPKGDEIDISTDQTVDVTLYYCTYDESAGVTKVTSRANSFNNVTTTRAPSNVVGQSKS